MSDHVGGPELVGSWRMLRRGGTLVSYGSASTLGDEGHRLRPYLPVFGRILAWSALPNGKRWPKHFRGDLTTVLRLLGLLASGKAAGKVVLVPGLDAPDRDASLFTRSMDDRG